MNTCKASAAPDPLNFAFGHHMIPLLSLPGGAEGLSGSARLAAAKEACKSAERVDRVLAMSGRFEIAVVPPAPDFFDPKHVTTKVRNHAWEAMRKTKRLQWVIPTRRPDLIATSLPRTWIGKGLQNVCIAYRADSDLNLTQNLNELRQASLQYRMVLLNSASPSIDPEEHLKDMDWVVFCGKLDETSLAKAIGMACRQAGVAFLFHQMDETQKNAFKVELGGDELSWPTHPFGSKVDLSRPTLQNLNDNSVTSIEPAVLPLLDDAGRSPIITSGLKSADHGIQSKDGSDPSTVMMDFVLVDSENCVSPPLESPPIQGDADQHEFTLLDGVVRRGLATFMEVGKALSEIRDRELWRAGGLDSWAEYCQSVCGLTKVHANRLIRAAQIAGHLTEVEPIGFTPVTESQIRPLCRLQTPELHTKAWRIGMDRAKGQPTAAVISEVVAELMASETIPKISKPDNKQRIRQSVTALRNAIQDKCPLGKILRLLKDLEKKLHL